MKIFHVYNLFDPRNDTEIRYIGVSCDPRRRLIAHLTLSKKKRTRKDKWIGSLLNEGIAPIMIVVNSFDDPDCAYEFEQKYIANTLSIPGNKLTNGTGGGKSNFNPTEDTIQKMRDGYYRRKALGQRVVCHNKPHSAQTKEFISNKNKGLVPPNKGIPMSLEQKQKLSQVLTGRKAWNKGLLHSEDHKLNLSKAWVSRKENSPITDETRRLLSEKATAQWARKKIDKQ